MQAQVKLLKASTLQARRQQVVYWAAIPWVERANRWVPAAAAAAATRAMRALEDPDQPRHRRVERIRTYSTACLHFALFEVLTLYSTCHGYHSSKVRTLNDLGSNDQDDESDDDRQDFFAGGEKSYVIHPS